jgi:hypothetical protein
MLVRDLIYVPSWSYASKSNYTSEQNSTLDKSEPPTHIRESLSNILLTYIDFRRPILDSKHFNTTKDDETINKVPEACIEEFYLYVSTWKGWQGELPTGSNSIKWEEVEENNTIHGAVSCTHSIEPSIDINDDLSDNRTNVSTTAAPPVSIAESFK